MNATNHLLCPACWSEVLPADAFDFELAARLGYHLWDAHPYQAALLRIFLDRPPESWPVIEEAA